MSKVALKAATSRAALKEAVALMKAAGLDTPVLDARLIVQHALGATWESLFLGPDRPLEEDERGRLAAMLARRAAREPVSRIVGRRQFWTLDLMVTPATLDPRADTETIVEAALALDPDRTRNLRILDLGTGTGALLLSLLTEYPAAIGVGVDSSPAAATIARTNAENVGVGDRAMILVGHWGDALGGAFDLIVANPPYIPASDLAGLPPEVRMYDPAEALSGGADGLDAYRAILPSLPGLLAPGGAAVFEIGMGQGEAVAALGRQYGLGLFGRRKDLAGIERALILRHR